MPLIVKVNPDHIAADYPDIKSPDGLFSPPPVETELNEQSPLLKEKIKAKHREFRKAVSRKIRRSLKMKRVSVLMLILIEVFERFAYYGILINFVLFLNKCCGWPMFVSVASVMSFSCISWLMCALAGIMADFSLWKIQNYCHWFPGIFHRYCDSCSGCLFDGTLLLSDRRS